MVWKPRSARVRPAPEAGGHRQSARGTRESTPGGTVNPARGQTRLVLRRPVASRPSVLLRPAASQLDGSPSVRTTAGAALTPGPRSLEESMRDWKDVQKEVLSKHVHGSLQCLEDMSSRGMVVTTHYSGTGAAEMATAQVLPGRVRFHGACDVNPTCQHVLLNHDPECAAEHVTNDLLARPPPEIVDKLRQTLKEYQDKAAARASTPGGSEKQTVIRDVGLEWVGAAMNILQGWAPKREDTASCLRHGGDCPAFPPRACASTPGPFHLEIDGINCQPWSAAGKRRGWLDARSIPCLVLIRTIVSIEPDAVCIECTPGFDFATLRRLLRGYRGDYAITSPQDFGCPVARTRMYMWFDRLLSLCQVEREVGTILDVSRRSLLVGPEIFLHAPRAAVQRQYYDMAHKASQKPDGPPRPKPLRRMKVKQPPPCKLRARDVLAAGLRTRYEGHRERVIKAHILPLLRRRAGACCVRDFNQSSGWGGAPQCQIVPTIMRSSKLVAIFESEDDDRLILPSELPSIHGISLPSHVLAELEPKKVASLVGNSMHLVQIGTFIQYALATRSYHLGRCASASSGTSTSAANASGSAPDCVSAAAVCVRRGSSSASMMD